MTEDENDRHETPRKKLSDYVPVGCLISLGTLAAVFFFIITLCARN